MIIALIGKPNNPPRLMLSNPRMQTINETKLNDEVCVFVDKLGTWFITEDGQNAIEADI